MTPAHPAQPTDPIRSAASSAVGRRQGATARLTLRNRSWPRERSQLYQAPLHAPEGARRGVAARSRLTTCMPRHWP